MFPANHQISKKKDRNSATQEGIHKPPSYPALVKLVVPCDNSPYRYDLWALACNSIAEGMQSKLSVDTYAARSLDGLKATMDMGHPFYKLSGSMGLIYVEARQRAPLVTICQNWFNQCFQLYGAAWEECISGRWTAEASIINIYIYRDSGPHGSALLFKLG
ncbi:uncharacterized protein MCYG_04522 [Microsporum canis CBS 113480]|uniref:Uncharacterized protein n=1 Tax=Arthroderma otae (strain ATCC MYA-4605 / CBS 113480) TaxID=554155 RepID=C5FPU8_ARTOC|nr:uncharacterized protein MCYG_04522 [Microsporum canis CBS 113480]EEQ31703.1 predicted protein [Microsporum canis CBS 113480]